MDEFYFERRGGYGRGLVEGCIWRSFVQGDGCMFNEMI